jgi:hypothetical protein
MHSHDSPSKGTTPVAAWLAAALLAAFSVPASALPPQETRTTFYATPALKKSVGSLLLQCNGREVRRGQETDFATTRTVRRCTGPVVPDPKVPCEMKPGGCARLPGG